ncbi:hypothetical protein HDV02_003923 [Globomyces sp. JEL0801]|nr:hypothetical protein HDV02_003923 [Globomyces sp. JEL0801]
MEAFFKSIEQLRKITGSDIKAGRILKSIGARLELNGTNDFNEQLKEVIEDIMDETEKDGETTEKRVVSAPSDLNASKTAPSTPKTVTQEHENDDESMCSSEDDQVDKDMKKATRRVENLLKLKESFASRPVPRGTDVPLPEDGRPVTDSTGDVTSDDVIDTFNDWILAEGRVRNVQVAVKVRPLEIYLLYTQYSAEQKRQFNILLSKGLEPKPDKNLKRRFGMHLARGRKLYLICKALGFPTLKEILPFINSLQSYLPFTEMTGPVFNLVLSMLNEHNSE